MMTGFDWIDEYFEWMKKNISVKKLQNGWTEIGTPFMDRHNDGLTVYARLNNENIILSDDGYIINDLLADGVSLKGKKRKSILETFLRSYGVELIDNEIVLQTTKREYPIAMHMFIQAMLSINDMFMLNDTSIKSIFIEDVASFLDAQDIIYTPSFIAKGSTGLEFNFHFQLAGRKSEILINSFNSINKSNLSSFLFYWQDIKNERKHRSGKEVSGLAIINDKKGVDVKYLEALTSQGTEYILFSERKREDNIKKLKVA